MHNDIKSSISNITQRNDMLHRIMSKQHDPFEWRCMWGTNKSYMLIFISFNSYNNSLQATRNRIPLILSTHFIKMSFLFLFSFSPPFPSVTPDWDLVGFFGGARRTTWPSHDSTTCAAAFTFGSRLPFWYTEQCSQSHLIQCALLCLFQIFGSRNPSVAQYIFVCLPRHLSFLTVPQFLRHVQNWWQNGSKSLLKVVSFHPLNSSIKNVYVVTPKNVHSTRMLILKAEWLNNK